MYTSVDHYRRIRVRTQLVIQPTVIAQNGRADGPNWSAIQESTCRTFLFPAATLIEFAARNRWWDPSSRPASSGLRRVGDTRGRETRLTLGSVRQSVEIVHALIY